MKTWAGRNADGNAVVPRLALVLLAALVLGGGATGGHHAKRCHGLYGLVRVCDAKAAAIPPPDATWITKIMGVRYQCSRWGAAPREFLVHCVPKKKQATKGAA